MPDSHCTREGTLRKTEKEGRVAANKFSRLLSGCKLSSNDQTWFPRCVFRYASHLNLNRQTTLPVTRESVVSFSRQLLDGGVPAWQRLQAVRAIACYRTVIHKSDQPALDEMVRILSRAAAVEKAPADHADDRQFRQTIRDNGDQNCPPCISKMQEELRLRHYSLEAEKAYLGWIRRFIRFQQSEELERFGENEIKRFLSDLAVAGKVAASTQNQALSALLFLYEKVFGRQLGYLDAIKSKKPERRPIVLSRQEISRLYPLFCGRNQLIFQLLYGAGMRHKEALRLRIKDIDFDQSHILVRDGKGEKDRITVLPEASVENLLQQIENARFTHENDLSQGLGEVYLPYALQKKYPNAARQFGWQYLFPSRQRSRDVRTGVHWIASKVRPAAWKGRCWIRNATAGQASPGTPQISLARPLGRSIRRSVRVPQHRWRSILGPAAAFNHCPRCGTPGSRPRWLPGRLLPTWANATCNNGRPAFPWG